MPKPFGHKVAAFTAAKAEQARTLKLRDVFGRSPGPGPKMQAPRTEAQREQAESYAGRYSGSYVSREETVPKTSWWTTPTTREAFDQAVVREQPRMRASSMGTVRGVKIE